ncbi:Krr1-domain-containing protein [Hesseltinella vesiculosa]|uniref:Krr1-domain-containing protein n=1 Tax=Hesseltinella vesiculosa TaxID=101127 RepID=A0A1X2GRC2_9FUNG|nr:Krr1-domain-containing protein [Hesseltinella vesiculosa]
MGKKSEVKVEIREREPGVEEYKKPALLVEYEQDVARENAELSSSDEEEAENQEEPSSDESDEDEDDTAAMLTASIDSQIFKTIQAIRSQDPSVYDSNKTFFTDKQFDEARASWEKKKEQEKAKGKKVTLKDYERQVLLEHGGYVNEDDQDRGLTHVQEQEQLKNAFKLAADDGDSDEEEQEDDDGLLVKREKSETELQAEEEDYRRFLFEHLKDDDMSAKAFKDWENFKGNPNVSADDAFLMDYVLNRGWVDKKGTSNPTYNDIVDEHQEVDVDRDEDEAYLDDVDRFESKYNFRFEEPGSVNIITHARDMDGSVRRKERKRQKDRERKKASKAAKKEQKTQELRQLKNEKRKEIHERLMEIQKITGTKVPGFEKLDLESDFDPAKYDEQMADMFNEEYYEGEGQDTEKPVFEDDDFDYSQYDQHGDDEEEEDIMMDADYLPGGDMYEKAKHGKQPASSSAPISASDKKSLDAEYKKLMDQYYSLDYEDIIGDDLPTRFKYTQTEAEDYGLTTEEILMADDKMLNKYIGLRTMAPFRSELKRQAEHQNFQRNKKRKYKEIQQHLQEKYAQFSDAPSKKKTHKKQNASKKGKA